MGFGRTAGACCSCLYCLAILGSVVVGILFATGIANVEQTLNDSLIQACISNIKVDVEPPQAFEFEILASCSYALAAMFGLLCCLVYCFKDSDNFNLCMTCSGCLLLLGLIASIAIYAHVFTYAYAVNEEFHRTGTCEDNAMWNEAYVWSLVGGGIAGGLLVFCCCTCCLMMCFREEEDSNSSPKAANSSRASYPNTTTYGNTSNRAGSPAPSAERRMVVRGSNYARSESGRSGGGAVELTDRQKEILARLLISAEVIEKCGFSLASDKNKVVLLLALKAIRPSGQTALRDAICLGVAKMLTLKLALHKLGVVGHQFIHIVLTDGADNRSSSTLADVRDLYQKIGDELGDRFFKTFFIGIGLGLTEKQQLQSIADVAGDSAELFNCSDVQISDVFDRIKLSLGIERRVAVATDGRNIIAAQQNRLYLQAEKQKFLVLFDLDMSGSMSGARWDRLQMALTGFFRALEETDIIGCVLFNHDAVCITGEILNDGIACKWH
eukprot:CAMPEP_0197079272 /NCGR_PEP_ID=MMETSP1384-20130603/213541_1 /TAXON_ID=29189 /ORGANISM="Ammonia sp." /LENGTH=496 /DNA_ID=CAMNT_0042518147 /DNA_START=48 /DNA_END=1538 /DNA_ORIENTATION=+